MTKDKKEKVVLEAIQRLVKNKGFDLKVHRMWADSSYFNVELDYVVNGAERHGQFSFVAKWFDPNYFGFSWIEDLQIPAKANDYQRVVLKIAYYFYKWYKRECQ